MNRDTMRGNWNELKGKVRQKWGQLTDDDLDVVKGEREELIGRIQQRYGQTRDQVERDVDLWMEEQRDPVIR